MMKIRIPKIVIVLSITLILISNCYITAYARTDNDKNKYLCLNFSDDFKNLTNIDTNNSDIS